MKKKVGKKISKRELFKAAFAFLFLSGALVTSRYLSPYLKPKDHLLRPPGANDEKLFLGKCIKCGQCVQVCPYRSVKLADIAEAAAMGTPYIDPAKRACYLCDLLPCVLSCPSGALDDEISEPKKAKIGDAKVISTASCFGIMGIEVSESDIDRLIAHGVKTIEEKELADKLRTFIGKPCTICRDICPYPDRDEAIIFLFNDDGSYFPEIKSRCAGCGVCLELCPSKDAVFTVIPI